MIKNIKYIAAALAVVLAASCNKIEGGFSGEDLIRFAPQSIGTKATVDSDEGLQAQTFAVVGLLDNASNFQNAIAYSGGSWNFVTEAKYPWNNGEHKFFGYTDGAGTLSSNKLTVSKVLTTADDSQTDLLFSDVFTSTAAAWKAAHVMGDCVPLHFRHLLSAVSVTLKNCTENDVTVTSVSAPAFPNSSSATVDFTTATDGVPAVTYGDVAVDGDFVTATALSSTPLAGGEIIDVLTQAKADAGSYHVIWPQTLPDGENAITVSVAYTMNDKEYTAEVALPADTWAANSKYDYVLQILPTDVRLQFDVQPWESVEVGTIDTSTGSINMSNVVWQNTKVKLTEDGEEVNTLDIDAFSVYMYNSPWVGETQYSGYYPAQGYFTVNYPATGNFRIGIIPAYGQTEVQAGMYEIYTYDSSSRQWVLHDQDAGAALPAGHETIYFQVRASSSVTGTHPEYKAQIDIWLQSSATAPWVSAYSEIRANYACIIPAN